GRANPAHRSLPQLQRRLRPSPWRHTLHRRRLLARPARRNHQGRPAMTDMQLLVDLALDIEGVTPARAEIDAFGQQLDDLTGAIAYTLGVLAGIVTSVAADHTTCRLPHCRTCR